MFTYEQEEREKNTENNRKRCASSYKSSILQHTFNVAQTTPNINMDEKILKAILCSCESVTKELETSTEYQSLMQGKQFLPKSDVIFNAISTSLTKLLSYKVSKEAYQRYSVRIHIMNVLRDYSRIVDDFECLKTFTDKKQTLKFIENLLEKYLTVDTLDNCTSNENLLALTSSLMCLTYNNSQYTRHLENLLVKLSQLESTEESEQLLCYAAQKSTELNLSLSTIEDIYASQKYKLVEEPLVDNFMSTYMNVNKTDNVNNSENVYLMEQLLKFICMSPRIFLIVFAFLKEVLVRFDYAPLIVNFIQSLITRIQDYCANENKNIVDLYPKKLQSCVILLQIDPSHHTHESKEGTLKMLMNIRAESKGTAIMLLSHFPVWLNTFGDYLVRNSEKVDIKMLED